MAKYFFKNVHLFIILQNFSGCSQQHQKGWKVTYTKKSSTSMKNSQKHDAKVLKTLKSFIIT